MSKKLEKLKHEISFLEGRLQQCVESYRFLENEEDKIQRKLKIKREMLKEETQKVMEKKKK